MGKWEMVRLGDVGTIITGNTPPKKEAIFYDSNDIPFFKPNDFSENTIEKLTIPNEYVSEKARKKIRLLPIGSVLVTCIGTIGKVGIVTCESTCNQQINAIIPHDKVIISEYLANAVLTRKAYLKQIANAPVVPIINKSNFSEVQIPLPPIDEQKRIAKNLDLASEIVKGYKEQLAELDKLVQSVFYEMFGDPSKNEKGLPLVRLCDCLHSIENGKSIICNSVPRFGNNPAILKLSAVTNGFYCESENKAMIGNNGFVESVEVKKGDLLFTRKNTPELVGMSAYVYNTTSKLMMPDLIFRLNTNDSCNKIFLWKLINHDLFRCKIMSLASGSAKSMSNISKARLNQLLIPLPPRKIQNHFAEFVTEIETQKAQVQQALTEAESLFNSLMQEYFE